MGLRQPLGLVSSPMSLVLGLNPPPDCPLGEGLDLIEQWTINLLLGHSERTAANNYVIGGSGVTGLLCWERLAGVLASLHDRFISVSVNLGDRSVTRTA